MYYTTGGRPADSPPIGGGPLYGGMPPYNSRLTNQNSAYGMVGFVLGLLAFLNICVANAPVVLGILGLVYSGLAMNRPGNGRGLAIAGLLLSLIALPFGLFFSFFYFVTDMTMFRFFEVYGDGYYGNVFEIFFKHLEYGLERRFS